VAVAAAEMAVAATQSGYQTNSKHRPVLKISVKHPDQGQE